MLILDTQLPPSLTIWITDTFKIQCYSATYLGLRDAADIEFLSMHAKNKLL